MAVGDLSSLFSVMSSGVCVDKCPSDTGVILCKPTVQMSKNPAYKNCEYYPALAPASSFNPFTALTDLGSLQSDLLNPLKDIIPTTTKPAATSSSTKSSKTSSKTSTTPLPTSLIKSSNTETYRYNTTTVLGFCFPNAS
jgi:hypothetical protein